MSPSYSIYFRKSHKLPGGLLSPQGQCCFWESYWGTRSVHQRSLDLSCCCFYSCHATSLFPPGVSIHMQRYPCWPGSPHRPERCRMTTLLAPLTCSGLAPKAGPSGADKGRGSSSLCHSCAVPASSALKPSCGAWDTSPNFLLWSSLFSELLYWRESILVPFCPESSVAPHIYPLMSQWPALHTEVLGEGSHCQSVKGPSFYHPPLRGAIQQIKAPG